MEKESAIPESCPVEKVELRRDVTVWGSYMWGYADVGADIYAALGLVMGAAHGGASLAFFVAGLIYIMIGLSYTEMASTYPVAGGGHYYALRGLGDFWGYAAGVALLLDYTIDIALFATASAGYMNFFMPYVLGIPPEYFAIDFWIFKKVNPVWAAETIILIVFLIWLNIRGVRESSLFNEIIGAIDIITESSIIILGFLLAWKPELFVFQWKTQFPSLKEFMYGSSLAIISFVGLESISGSPGDEKAGDDHPADFNYIDLYSFHLRHGLFYDGPRHPSVAGVSAGRSGGQTRSCHSCFWCIGRPLCSHSGCDDLADLL